jgi:hypothetical protein
MKATLRKSLVGLTFLAFLGGGTADAQALASPDAARNLVHAFEKAGSTAIAVADPDAPGRFVAALYIPGSQLLVVSAGHPSAEAVAYRIEAGQHREVYLDLQATPAPDGKFFVQDAGADGILNARRGSGQVDVLYEDGRDQTLFNGDADAQDLTRAEYEAKLAAADARYARVLKLLTATVLSIGDVAASSAR